MANDPGREVKLVAGDTTYLLYPGNRALRLIERETDRPLLDVISRLESLDVTLITTMLWAMLQKHHPELALDDIDDIIDDAGGLVAMVDTLSETFEKAFPGMQDDEPDSGKARAGTGKRSSPAASPPG